MSVSSSRLSNGSRPLPTASFALRSEQVAQIKKLAIQRNTSQSAIVREAVDLLMRDTVRQALEQLQRARRFDGAPLFPDPDHATQPADVRGE